MKPTLSSLIMLFTARLLGVFSHILHKNDYVRGGKLPLCLQTVWNPESEDITYQGELLSESEVCVGLDPHHLMFEITGKPPRKKYPKGIF